MNTIEQQALLQDIVADPDNDIPRLIYLDWLLDNNRDKEANYLEFQLQNPDMVDEIQEPMWGISLIRNRRGFPEYFECDINNFVKYGPQIVKAQPITRVKLTDRHPEVAVLLSKPFEHSYYWFPSSGPYPSRHSIPDYIHYWMLKNECGRKNNCWDSEDKAWYALILWARAYEPKPKYVYPEVPPKVGDIVKTKDGVEGILIQQPSSDPEKTYLFFPQGQ